MTNLHCWPVEHRRQVETPLPVQTPQSLSEHGCLICYLAGAGQSLPGQLGWQQAALLLCLGLKGEGQVLCFFRLLAGVLAQPSTCGRLTAAGLKKST